MDAKIVELWEANKDVVRAAFAAKHPEGYVDIVRAVLEAINPDDGYRLPDPKRVHEIDDGHYQGTLVYVIAAGGYQPDDYWYVRVGYGSCSGCDTLQAICGYSDDPPTDDQVAQYMTLALHIVQGMKLMDGEAA